MTAESRTKRVHGGIDPAALAVAGLAAAVSVLAPPGPYGPSSILIGATILCVVRAYDIDPHRDAFQSLAYSAVCGLVAQIVLGYPLEYLFSSDRALRLSALFREFPQCTSELIKNCEKSYSQVPPILVLGLWIALTLFFFVLDRRRPSNNPVKTDIDA